ncbi:hypothetical protein [Deinococcus maricopensis]|uniref:hypothetical protein n=1 Tax=Deinococcus maricopensis TaxID=309887 RepID=UPI0002D8C550|nr:hypothetical protein [Deinococcus maricopensis]
MSASIADAGGHVIAHDRNRLHEPRRVNGVISGYDLKRAEVNALLALRTLPAGRQGPHDEQPAAPELRGTRSGQRRPAPHAPSTAAKQVQATRAEPALVRACTHVSLLGELALNLNTHHPFWRA